MAIEREFERSMHHLSHHHAHPPHHFNINDPNPIGQAVTAIGVSMAANPAAWVVGGVVVAGLAIAYFASREEGY